MDMIYVDLYLNIPVYNVRFVVGTVDEVWCDNHVVWRLFKGTFKFFIHIHPAENGV